VLALAAPAAGPAHGQGPSPTPAVVSPVDPRSSGEGPGLQGSPLQIALGVVLLGALAVGVTALWARLTRDE
jgi:hypothetical protein